MFPLKDDNPRTLTPIITVLIILMNIGVFYLELTTDPMLFEALLNNYALVPVRDFSSGLQPLPYLTSMFLHGGFLHILANLWSFWIFGDNVEGAMGHGKFLIFYLLCGIGAALTHAVLNPGSQLPVVGASGAISGVMGAYLFLFPRARIRMLAFLIFWPIFFDLPAFVFLIFWFLGQLLSAGSLVVQTAGQAGQNLEEVGGIAFAAHIGGFICGIVLMPFFRKRGWKRPARRI